METIVILSKHARKDLAKVPTNIAEKFDLWMELIENEGLASMQQVNGYRDHALQGNRKNQRSSSLSRSWRIIYTLDEQENLLTVEVIEVNHHEY